ncbi:MAG: hypothetical protein C4324_01055 [Blastocatellia bacterium]
MTILRNFLAVMLGLLIGGFVNMAIVTAGSLLILPPPGIDPTNVESLRAGIDRLKPVHYVAPFLAHALSTFAGALVAALVSGSGRRIVAGIVGLFFLSAGIAAAAMMPAPRWFVFIDLVFSYVPMAWLGFRLSGKTP